MIGEWLELLSWRDLLDVALVTVVIYNLLLLIRGTRAVQILLGLVFLGGIYFAARATELSTLETLLRNFIFFLPFAVIVLFQQEIRKALAAFGRNPLLSFGVQHEVETSIPEVVLGASALAAKRIGALIVIQRVEGLRNYIENGIALDARVSYDLLINIFNPDTPLHDGAAIIQGDRVAAAACFLPLTLDSRLSKELGTRHRAALGISQETDALAVIVSEETGAISIAVDGRLIQGLKTKALRNHLYRFLIAETAAGEGAQAA